MGLSRSRSRREHRLNAWLTAALCLALLFAGNRLAREQLELRVDLSEDQLYAPSPVGRRMLRELDDLLSVRAYFTGRSRLGPVQIAKRRLIDQLLEFEEAADGRLDLAFVDPNESAEARAEATELGIRPVPMSAVQGTSQVTQDTWLGLVLRYRGRELVVPFVLPQGFEYSFLTSLQKLLRTEDVVVGFVTNDGRGDEDEFGQARRLLEGQYRLREVLDLAVGAGVPDDVDVLVVARPRELHPRAAFAVDQFLQRGGRALLLLDRHAVDLRTGAVATAPTGLERLLDAWGLALSSELVWDQRRPNALRLSGTVRIDGQDRRLPRERVPYPFWPRVEPDGLDAENPVTARLGRLDLFWTHALARAGSASAPALAYEELARTSEESWLVPASDATLLDRAALEARAVALAARGGGAPRTVVASLSGRLPSPFTGGAPAPLDPVADALWQADVERALAAGDDPPEREELTTDEDVRSAASATQVVVAGDADWIADGEFASPQNQLFFASVIDWLALEDELLALRSRLPRERELVDFLEEERRDLGLVGLLAQGSDPGDAAGTSAVAELESEARASAARRRQLRMLAATGGALLLGGFVLGLRQLALRRGRAFA